MTHARRPSDPTHRSETSAGGDRAGDATPGGSDQQSSRSGARSRRSLLAALAAAGTAAVAGCSGGDGTTTDADTTTAGTTATTANPTSAETTAGDSEPAMPATGDLPDELAGVDEAVRSFVADRGVTAAALGVSNDGEVVLERGYGWAGGEGSAPLSPDAPFRIASLTKSMTAAAVRSLFGDGLSRDTPVLSVLDLEPPSGELGDERLRDVTVDHLLSHAGGWDANATFDPVFHHFAIADALGLSGPPDTCDIARYMLGQPLQFEPGSRHVYSNFGYALLGLVVEAVSDTPYPEYVRGTLFDGSPPGPLYEGRTLPDERRDAEPPYESAAQCPNAMALDPAERVPCADGGFYLQGVGGAGELVTNTRTLLALLRDHPVDGFAAAEEYPHEPAFGSLPGTFTMLHEREDGVAVAVLLNRRGRGYGSIADVVGSALDDVDAWP
ncbi:serine hydrolase domain-containing protein [Halostella litorea]|uniref:serine hydrolase domain-containing protein n=1 Tax=Halostella litorea TaxID=2528831 RepID=UPI0010932937|nr:serine hydrolase domain-containing protein [Halostella litorea]